MFKFETRFQKVQFSHINIKHQLMKKLLLAVITASTAILSIAASQPYERSRGGDMKEIGRATSGRVSLLRAKAKLLDETPAGAIEVPFTHSLGKGEADITNLYIAVDANGDTKTWKPGGFTGYSVCMKPSADDVDACDDWLISPAVNLIGGKTYRIGFKCATALTSGTEEKMEVFIGTEQTAEAMTIEIVPAFTFAGKDFQLKEFDFNAPADGAYHFGFHAISNKATSGNPKLCDFSLAEAPAPVPDNAIEVPFTHTLGKNEKATTDLYTVIDANGDTRTWKPGGFTGYSVCMKPSAADVDACDDWLVSVPVHLFAGKSYRLSFEEGSALSSGTEDKLEIFAGTAPTVEALTQEIVPAHTFTGQTFAVCEKDFSVDADGYYYFGFHALSNKSTSGNPKICNFSIAEATEKVDPPVAGTLSYELAPKGELKATVTYVAPTMSQGGAALSAISKVEVKTNWIVSHTFTDVTPGQTITFETELYNNGYNRIEATAFVADEAGETVMIKDFYAGPDNPLPVTGLTISLSEDYKHVTVSWEPVGETGEKGGYVDTEKVVYYIFDAFGSYYDPALASTAETSYTFDYSDMTDQDFVAYQVTAGVGEYYYSLASTSDIVTVGEPYQLPWAESFSDAYYSQMWLIDPASTTSAVMCGTMPDKYLQTNMADEGADPEYLNSHDGDNGFFYIMPFEKDAVYGFSSAKIDVSAVEKPVFEFFYQGKGSRLDAMVAADGGDFEVIRAIDLKQEPTDDWTLCRIDLSRYRQSRYIQIELRLTAIHNDDEYMWSVPIDNIRVRNLVDNDLRLVCAVAPSSVKAGENVEIECRVENMGTADNANATVVLYRGAEKADEQPLGSVAPNQLAVVKFSQSAGVIDHNGLSFGVKVVNEGDADVSNNEVAIEVGVNVPNYPTVANLSAIHGDDNTVSLSWSAPELAGLTEPSARVEDFESPEYEALTIDDFGGWTMYDVDNLKTYTFMDDTRNPYRTLRMAYQLYNPAVAGVPAGKMEDVAANSGTQFLAAWSAQGVNDNWLVSPELSGAEQTVSFYARSFTIAFAESFEVLYSTTDKRRESFTAVDNVENYPEDGKVPEVWTEFKAALPAGAKYFAIRHTANDTYALFVDDISFEAAPVIPADIEVSGYNVYRNGVKLNETPVSQSEFVDEPGESGNYSYRVSAVYNHGESIPCEAVDIDFTYSGIGNAVSDGITISGGIRCIKVSVSSATDIIVTATDGRTCWAGEASGETVIHAVPGLYIVKAGDAVAKVVVASR